MSRPAALPFDPTPLLRTWATLPTGLPAARLPDRTGTQPENLAFLADLPFDTPEAQHAYVRRLRARAAPANRFAQDLLPAQPGLDALIAGAEQHLADLATFDGPSGLLTQRPERLFMSVMWYLIDYVHQRLLLGRVHYPFALFFLNLCYLYVDYCFDDAATSPAKKYRIARYCGQRLQQPTPAYDALSEKIDALMRLFEGRYPRTTHPHLYDRLRETFTIERRSMQYQGMGWRSQQFFLRLTAEKGIVTSLCILDLLYADAPTSPSPAQQALMRGFGFLMQLIDDVSDYRSDQRAGCHSSCSHLRPGDEFEQHVNRIFQLIQVLVAQADQDSAFAHHPDPEDTTRFLESFLVFFTLYAVGRHPELFPQSYYQRLSTSFLIAFADLPKVYALDQKIYQYIQRYYPDELGLAIP